MKRVYCHLTVHSNNVSHSFKVVTSVVNAICRHRRSTMLACGKKSIQVPSMRKLIGSLFNEWLLPVKALLQNMNSSSCRRMRCEELKLIRSCDSDLSLCRVVWNILIPCHSVHDNHFNSMIKKFVTAYIRLTYRITWRYSLKVIMDARNTPHILRLQ